MIRPIDLADNISKAPYADKVTQVQRQAPETDQQTFHMRLLEEAAEEQSRTNETNEEEKVRNEREGNQAMAGGTEQDEQNEGTDENGEPDDDSPVGKHVDVLV